MRWYELPLIPVKRRVKFAKGHTYTDKKTSEELERVSKAYTGGKLSGPVALIVKVYKQKKQLKRGASEPYCYRPDADNIVKAIMDGLNGKAWDDDKQVTFIAVEKLDRRNYGGEWCRFAVIPADEVQGISIDAVLI